jgi:hypothetical protein
VPDLEATWAPQQAAQARGDGSEEHHVRSSHNVTFPTIRAPKSWIRYRSPADRRSRAQRWHAAVAKLIALQDDYRTWLNAPPQNLEASATAEALRAICDLDRSDIESVEPLRGFGRD